MLAEIPEAERVFAWRMERFLHLGFTPAQAEDLAASGVDWHDAETYVQAAEAAGSPTPHRVVFRLLI